MMAVDQYYNVITGVQGALEEIEEYYPNWTIEDFKEVYLAMEVSYLKKKCNTI